VSAITNFVASRDFDPASNEAVAILLHGYGSNERDLPDLMSYLPAMPWVSLRAPEGSPHGGFAWSQITNPGNPEAAVVEPATETIWNWIDENVAANAPLVLIGFSQGGLMATQLLRTRPKRIKATVILAGFTMTAEQPGDSWLAANKPKVIYCRGKQDQVISPEAVARTNTWLQGHTRALTKTYEGLGHSVDQRVMDDVSSYLESVFAK
jgi:phospholipase/carboxylesterase